MSTTNTINEYEYLDTMSVHFQNAVATVRGVQNLFTTDVGSDALWDAYLNAFPAELRQHYTCNACHSFIKHFGDLVVINQDGKQVSPFWTAAVTGEHAAGFVALENLVAAANVTGVFYASETTWGTPANHDSVHDVDWRHLSVRPPRHLVYRGRVETASQAMAKKREAFGGLRRALGEFSVEHVRSALNLVESGTLYRGDLVKAPLEWFADVQRINEVRSFRKVRDNQLWLVVASASEDLCHIRGKLAGTLLKDIAEGTSAAEIKRSYELKADPANYQRAQVAPAAGNIAQAEKLIAELGLEPSLARRYARLSEVPTLWSPRIAKTVEAAKAGPVFGHLKPKDAVAKADTGLVVPSVTMTWEKFQKTVLADAISIEALVPDSGNRMAALVTAADADAPPILQWDLEDARNPMSWYYAGGGVDASIRARLQKAGARYEGNDIRCSLSWDNRNDLDLACITPRGQHIDFGNKRGCDRGGWLDVDANVIGDTTTPVENIRWETGKAPSGLYRFYVNNFRYHESARKPIHYRLELQVGNQVFHLDGVISGQTGTDISARQEMVRFTYTSGQPIECPSGMRSAAAPVTGWGVTPGTFVKVNGITTSPNLWDGDAYSARGRHMLFLLEGCRDSQEGAGRGFFSEMLKGELHTVRATLEAYTATATIEGTDDANACGIGMSYDSPWDLTLRVQTSTGVRVIKVDRWD